MIFNCIRLGSVGLLSNLFIYGFIVLAMIAVCFKLPVFMLEDYTSWYLIFAESYLAIEFLYAWVGKV